MTGLLGSNQVRCHLGRQALWRGDSVSPTAPGKGGGLSSRIPSWLSRRHVSESSGLPGAFTSAWPRRGTEEGGETGAVGLLLASVPPAGTAVSWAQLAEREGSQLINSVVLGPATGAAS